MLKCGKCNSDLESNAKFCTNCGAIVLSKIESKGNKSDDLPLYFLIVSFIIGIPGGIQQVKNQYDVTSDLSILEYIYMLFKIRDIPLDLYAEVIGASLSPVLISSIIIGFIWGIKFVMLKRYEKPILYIFIGTIILSLLSIGK